MTISIGQSIGRYTIMEVLGEGGMAVVYKAFDTRLECDVAIKVIRTDAFPPAALESVLKRFEKEARSLARLTHPNIIPILDYGDFQGTPYLVMKFVSGGTLKNLLGKPLSVIEATRILIPVAKALAYAHSADIIHRDVKPSNVLITQTGEPMLTDFGVAKILVEGSGHTLTGTGVGIGTPEYMAPEQGMGGEIDGRADIYSLGIVFYELVTGRKPYTADTPMAILLKQINDPIPRPKIYAPSISETAEKFILKALAKNAEDRYPDMETVVAALKQLNRESTVTLPAAEHPVQEVAAPRGAPAVPAEATLVEPAATTSRPPGPHDQVTQVDQPKTPGSGIPAVPQVDRKDQPKPERRTRSASAHKPAQSWLRGWIAKAKITPLTLAAVFGAVLLLGVFSIGVYSLARIKPTANPAPTVQAVAGIKDSQIVFTSNRSDKREIYTYSGSQVVQVTHTEGTAESWEPFLAGDGTLYFTSNRSGKKEIYSIDPTGAMNQITHTPGGAESWKPYYSPDFGLFFTSNRSGKAEIFYVKGDQMVQVTTTLRGDSFDPTLDQAGNVYFTSTRDDKREIYRLDATGTTRITHTPGEFESWGMFLDRDGNAYFTSSRSGNEEIYTIQNGQTVQVTHTLDHKNSWGLHIFDNGLILFCSNRSGKAEIYQYTNGSGTQLTHTPDPHMSWLD